MNATATTPHRRTGALEQWLDPPTFRLLSALEVPLGGRCLDVASGSGSVARWLARQVGPAGSVVVGGAPSVRPANVEPQRLDVLGDPPGPDEYDVVHARLVLGTLPGRSRALTNLVHAVRPGGWLVVCELDWTTCRPASNTPEADRVGAAARRVVARLGLDIDFGGHLPRALETQGLEEVGGEAVVSWTRGGEPAAAFCRHALERLRDEIVAAGTASAEDFDRVQARLEDPAFSGMSPAVWLVWGRRPM